jgi:hypothetical protein
MNGSTDPRIHAMRLLRHANVHLSASALSHVVRGAVWDGPMGRQEFEYFLVLADNLSESIRATRDAPKYSAVELSAMLDWLEREQREWGINHAVLRCAELYAAVVGAAL